MLEATTFAKINNSEEIRKAIFAKDLGKEGCLALQTTQAVRPLLRAKDVLWIEAPDNGELYSAARDVVDALYPYYSPASILGTEIIIETGPGYLCDRRLGKIIWQDGDLEPFSIVSRNGDIAPEVFLALQSFGDKTVISFRKDLEISARVQTIIKHIEKDLPKWAHI